jgi:cytochrome c-type biogenesis protein CcmH
VLEANKSVNTVAITQAINEAKSRLAQGSVASPQEQAPSSGEQVVGLTVNVAISEKIHNKLIEQGDKTVFIYAIPADGPRMPVAAVKMMASDLPTRIVLDDSRAMNPQVKISNFEQVHLFAVISQQGTPGIKPGDYQGRLNNIAVNTSTPIDIVINTIVE